MGAVVPQRKKPGASRPGKRGEVDQRESEIVRLKVSLSREETSGGWWLPESSGCGAMPLRYACDG